MTRIKEILHTFWRKLDYWEYLDGNDYENFLIACTFMIGFIIVVNVMMMLLFGR